MNTVGMKKWHGLLLMVFLFGISATVRAQSVDDLSKGNLTVIDTAVVLVEYRYDYRDREEDAEHSKDLMGLYIGKKMSMFYHNAYSFFYSLLPENTKKEYQRSTEKRLSFKDDAYENARRYEDCQWMIYSNYPEEGMQACFQRFLKGQSFSRRGNESFYYVETIPSLEWQLEDGDSIVCDYPCQKAVACFRGRTWHVWYTTELPYQEGPWKLCGLPGVIMKAEDASGDFCFEAIAVNELKEKGMLPHTRVYQKTTPRRMYEYMDMQYKNPEGLWRLLMGDWITDLMISSGQQLKNDQGTPCLLEKFE